jgi:hypothetical protein
MTSKAERVFQKLKYGYAVSLGPIERRVLAATPNACVVNFFKTTKEIAEETALPLRQTRNALHRLREKGYVDGGRPPHCKEAWWTSFPFFRDHPKIASELFPEKV